MLYGDDQTKMSFPWVTLGVVCFCIAVFVWQQFIAPQGSKAIVDAFGCTPLVMRGEVMVRPDLPHPHPLFTLLTSSFLHADIFHLAGNMLFLLIFGSNIEDSFQWPVFLAFIAVCAVGPNAAEILHDPSSPVPRIGASGFISGIMGSYMVLFPKAKLKFIEFIGYPVLRFYQFELPAWSYIGCWALIQFNGLLNPPQHDLLNIAFLSHIVGFLMGAALGLLLNHLGIAATNASDLVQAD